MASRSRREGGGQGGAEGGQGAGGGLMSSRDPYEPATKSSRYAACLPA